MNVKLLNKFRYRWKNLERFENEELINTSIEEKFLKTVSVIQLGFGLGYSIDKETLKDINKTRLRWIKLKMSA